MRKSPSYPAMNRPRLTGGIDSTAWGISFLLALVAWAVSHSAFVGGGTFGVLWFAVAAATRNDPKAPFVYFAACRLKSVYCGAMRPDNDFQ